MDTSSRVDALRSAAWVLLAILVIAVWYGLLDLFLGAGSSHLAGVPTIVTDLMASVLLGVLALVPVWLARRAPTLQRALVIVTVAVIAGWLLMGVLELAFPEVTHVAIGSQLRFDPVVSLIRGVAAALTLAAWVWMGPRRAAADESPGATTGGDR